MTKNSLQPLVAILGITFLVALPATSQLHPRTPYPKPGHSLPSEEIVESVIVKFHEGSRVRLRGGSLVTLDRSPRDLSQLATQRLDEEQVATDIEAFSAILASDPLVVSVSRAFFASTEAVLARRRASGESTSSSELADLDLYYRIEVPEGTTAGAVVALIARINALASVEVAYAASIPSTPADIPPPTPDFFAQGRQEYLENASLGGIDARYAWTVPGGKGDGVRIVDVENAWNLAHEDFPTPYYQSAENSGSGTSHGDAVVGILAAPDNGYGVTGIAHRASIGIQDVFGGIRNAINQAAISAGAGGIVLVEHQSGNLPVEIDSDNFDAIQTATANGVVVVEAAGNGSYDLDDAAVYCETFNRLIRDSGAIYVGAGTGPPRIPASFTNYGSRVDVQGWGQTITTLGGSGELFPGNGLNQRYTSTFGGTSGASAIVAGAAAAIQGAVRARNLPLLSSLAMRQLLRDTGTPQSPGRQIGPLPNLRAALGQLLGTFPKKAQFLSLFVPTSMVPGRQYTVSVTVKNTGEITWNPIGPQCNAYRLAQVGDAAWNPARAELSAPVAPGGQANLSFTVTAPSAAGTYSFQLRMVHECVEFFGSSSPNVGVRVGEKNAQIVAQNVPPAMIAGQPYSASVTVKNTGTLTWSPVGPQCDAYRLAQIGNLAWTPIRVELPSCLSLEPSQVTLPINGIAPSTPGPYNFQVRMVHECVEFFGDLGPNVVVTVQPPPQPHVRVVAFDGITITPGSTYQMPSTVVNVPISRGFTIYNDGVGTLTIANPTTFVSGQNFSLLIAPPASIAPGGSGEFRIRLHSAPPGTFTGAVSLQTNELGATPFEFNLRGTVDPPPNQPHVRVVAFDGITIAPGSTYQMPSTTVNDPISRGFTIYNDGVGTLTIANPTTFVSGQNLTLITAPPASIAPGGTGEFRIRLHSATAGIFTGAASLQTNEVGATPFEFNLRGTVNP